MGAERILELDEPSKDHYFQEKLQIYRLQRVTVHFGLWKRSGSTNPIHYLVRSLPVYNKSISKLLRWIYTVFVFYLLEELIISESPNQRSQQS